MSFEKNFIGLQVKDYRFHKLLGKGAFGYVYQALQVKKGEQVAIKVIEIERFQENDGILGQLIQSESQGLQLVKSDHVVGFVECFQDHTHHFLVMEFCDSGDLDKQLRNPQTRLTEQDAISIIKQILQGLKDLHSCNIIHRDLKLANILIHNQSTYKIADLGFCKVLQYRDQQSQLQLGSMFTMAPEIMRQESYGLSSDMFSVGVILYYILYRKYPFQERDYLKKEQPPINFPENNKINVSDHTKDMIKNMLAFDPIKRITFKELGNHHALGKSKFNSTINRIQLRGNLIDISQNQEFYIENSQKIEEENKKNEERMKTFTKENLQEYKKSIRIVEQPEQQYPLQQQQQQQFNQQLELNQKFYTQAQQNYQQLQQQLQPQFQQQKFQQQPQQQPIQPQLQKLSSLQQDFLQQQQQQQWQQQQQQQFQQQQQQQQLLQQQQQQKILQQQQYEQQLLIEQQIRLQEQKKEKVQKEIEQNNQELNQIYYFSNVIAEMGITQLKYHFLLGLLCKKTIHMCEQLLDKVLMKMPQIQNDQHLQQFFQEIQTQQNLIFSQQEIISYQLDAVKLYLNNIGDKNLQILKNFQIDENELKSKIYYETGQVIKENQPISRVISHIVQACKFCVTKNSDYLQMEENVTFDQQRSKNICDNSSQIIREYEELKNQY